MKILAWLIFIINCILIVITADVLAFGIDSITYAAISKTIRGKDGE